MNAACAARQCEIGSPFLLVPVLVALFAPALALGEAATRPPRPVTILANPGPFGSVQQAALAEQQVNWQDADLTDDKACTESFAATELRHFLALCADAREQEISLAGPEQLPARGDVFLIGSGDSNPLIGTLKSPDGKAPRPHLAESFRILAYRQDGRTITVIQGADRAGALYGVYAYLEQLGVRFYGVGAQDTWLPTRPVEPPTRLDLSAKPDYLTRGFWVEQNRGDRTFFLWMARNRMNLWRVTTKDDIPFLKKLGVKLNIGGHSIQLRCLNPKGVYPYQHSSFGGAAGAPPDPYPVSLQYAGDRNGDGQLTYFEAHPEWYGLRGGRRSSKVSSSGDNYCTSNRDATAELLKNLVALCAEGSWRDAELLDFWMLDAGHWCECEACRKQGTCTDRLMGLVHAAQQAFKRARAEGRLERNLRIVTLAYYETLPPPSKPLPADFDYDNCIVTCFPIERCYAHAFADPACTEVNESFRKELLGWTAGAARHYRGPMMVGEYYNVSKLKSLPMLYTRIMAQDIPWYYQAGVRHFHYMHPPLRLWGTWRLNHYLLGRLLWDVHANPQAIFDEYLARLYPDTAVPIRAFYRELELAMSNFKAVKHYIRVDGQRVDLRKNLVNDKLPLFPTEHLRYEPHHPTLNDGPDMVEMVEAMGRARRAMDDALQARSGAAERQRLREDERRFAYGEAMVQLYYRLVRTAIFHRKGEVEEARRELALAERQAAILKKIVDLVQVSSNSYADAKDGFDASGAAGVCEHFRAVLGVKQGPAPDEKREPGPVPDRK